MSTFSLKITSECAAESLTLEHQYFISENAASKTCYSCQAKLTNADQEQKCFGFVCLECADKFDPSYRCLDCNKLFSFICYKHGTRAVSQRCNTCVGLMEYSALDKVYDWGNTISEIKRQSHGRVSLQDSLSSKSTKGLLKVVSFNVNGSTKKHAYGAVGNLQRRKLVGEAFVTACQGDVILLQDSPWEPTHIMLHFNTPHQYNVVGSKCAAVAFDKNKFDLLQVLDRTKDFSTFTIPADYQHADFAEIGHRNAANGNTPLANI